MAKGVRKTFKSVFKKFHAVVGDVNLTENIEKILGPIEMGNRYLKEVYPVLYENAVAETRKETKQAMEAFIHNMCTMHSRGGGQIVFSSINYGTDTSPEGRMVMHALLDATEEGLGNGETPIFPIQILKVKDGITFSEEDYQLAVKNIDNINLLNLVFEAPNFDIFIRACQVSCKRLFPNFAFLDASFNKHADWKEDDPKRYINEIAYMGCRTRVYDDVNGERTTIGRGNLSFSTINLVRPAILADKNTDYYLEKIRQTAELIANQLYARYQFQRKAKAKQFPFLLGQGVWKNGQELKPNDNVEDALNTGTLAIGFIGLAEALVALTGKHHGECEESQKLGLKIIQTIRDVCEEYKKKHSLNYTCIATPAEGLAGRFTCIDSNDFGVIPGVTDKEYYTNSNHVPVYFPITITEKIKIEAPYHKICNAGHIFYVEADSEIKKNLLAYLKIIREMFYNDIGYGAINHPIDRCLKCSYEGAIDKACSSCGETEAIDRIRRITGYLVGTMERWNSFKRAEEEDRIKHQ